MMINAAHEWKMYDGSRARHRRSDPEPGARPGVVVGAPLRGASRHCRHAEAQRSASGSEPASGVRAWLPAGSRAAGHLSLNKDAPVPRAVQAVGRILPTPILGGLPHQYVRIF
jgi:hypothetical protein